MRPWDSPTLSYDKAELNHLFMFSESLMKSIKVCRTILSNFGKWSMRPGGGSFSESQASYFQQNATATRIIRFDFVPFAIHHVHRFVWR